MSVGTSEIASNNNLVDVDEFAKENGTNSEKSCDSGIESTETGSETFQASSDSETSPIKSISNYEIDLVLNSENVNRETKKDQETSKLQGISASLTDFEPCYMPQVEITCNISKDTEEISPNIKTMGPELKKITNQQSTSSDDSQTNLTASHLSLYSHNSNQINNGLATSCTSLENEIECQKITKSFSRSAENISNLHDSSLSTSNSNLDKEEILNQFSLHKKQVNATQRIPENVDNKYRIPKEILSQDLGNIVKNVHGMFSSVSGSLKYYTHRTNQKPIKPVKINSKIMTDIFEDENVEYGTIEEAEAVIPEKEINEEIKEDLDPKYELLRTQVESLEKLLVEQRKDNGILKDKVKEQVNELHDKDQRFKEIEIKLELMSKRVEQAEREKDAAVMRYASVECAAIEAKRAAEIAQRAERAGKAELELISGKVKSANSEKQRIIQLYDDKCHELQTSEKELFKVREDIKELEGRLKWTQSKLRMEMDAYKESTERADKLSQQVSELEAARDAAVINSSDSIKAKQLESELKEVRAALILCRHEKEELDRRLSTNIHQLETCKRERDAASAHLALSLSEIEQLKISNLRLEEEAAELAALRAKAALADTLSSQLERETARANEATEALTANRALAETCARREASALSHAALLTASHVAARAADHAHDYKAQALSADNASLRERVASLETECTQLRTSLSEETDRRNLENRVLARKVAELTEEVAEGNKRLEWEKGENGVLKKKHASAIKELNRELQRSLKRCEQLEAKLPPPEDPSTRTGSVTSLSSSESAPQDDRLQNGHADSSPELQAREPDRQALIERIVSLQRAAARRSERCEFLEEHSKQLTEELRNKSRLLRQLLCSLPTGAVTSPHRDLNKKQIASLGGGAMAALWGGDPAGMTLDLSLEMNKRLQAVLEDTLLKNITLKDNMDTLGAEISRLKGPKSEQ